MDYNSNTLTSCGTISVEENKMKCIFDNAEKIKAYKTKVDGGLICDNSLEKCDYMVYWTNKSSFVYYIELKGSNVSKALSQLTNTIELTKNEFKDYSIKSCVVICSRFPQLDSSIQIFQKKLKEKNIEVYIKCRQANFRII